MTLSKIICDFNIKKGTLTNCIYCTIDRTMVAKLSKTISNYKAHSSLEALFKTGQHIQYVLIFKGAKHRIADVTVVDGHPLFINYGDTGESMKHMHSYIDLAQPLLKDPTTCGKLPAFYAENEDL